MKYHIFYATIIATIGVAGYLTSSSTADKHQIGRHLSSAHDYTNVLSLRSAMRRRPVQKLPEGTDPLLHTLFKERKELESWIKATPPNPTDAPPLLAAYVIQRYYEVGAKINQLLLQRGGSPPSKKKHNLEPKIRKFREALHIDIPEASTGAVVRVTPPYTICDRFKAACQRLGVTIRKQMGVASERLGAAGKTLSAVTKKNPKIITSAVTSVGTSAAAGDAQSNIGKAGAAVGCFGAWCGTALEVKEGYDRVKEEESKKRTKRDLGKTLEPYFARQRFGYTSDGGYTSLVQRAPSLRI